MLIVDIKGCQILYGKEKLVCYTVKPLLSVVLLQLCMVFGVSGLNK